VLSHAVCASHSQKSEAPDLIATLIYIIYLTILSVCWPVEVLMVRARVSVSVHVCVCVFV